MTDWKATLEKLNEIYSKRFTDLLQEHGESLVAEADVAYAVDTGPFWAMVEKIRDLSLINQIFMRPEQPQQVQQDPYAATVAAAQSDCDESELDLQARALRKVQTEQFTKRAAVSEALNNLVNLTQRQDSGAVRQIATLCGVPLPRAHEFAQHLRKELEARGGETLTRLLVLRNAIVDKDQTVTPLLLELLDMTLSEAREATKNLHERIWN